MEEIIAVLRSRADILLFDAPPVIAVTDAAVLGMKVDGVLLVVAAGRTRREHARQARELLERAHVRVVGAVLTDVPTAMARRYY
jgi:non-specific protein-tyrosine kinase